MVTPVTSGLAGQQQPIQNNTARQDQSVINNERRDQVEQNPREDDVRATGTSTSETQDTNAQNNGQQESPALQNPNDFQSLVSQEQDRGSVIDITV